MNVLFSILKSVHWSLTPPPHNMLCTLETSKKTVFHQTGQLVALSVNLSVDTSLFSFPLTAAGSLQATRALMIVGIIVSISGLGVACMGMKCTTCGGGDKLRKSRVAMTGGIILLVGGEDTDEFKESPTSILEKSRVNVNKTRRGWILNLINSRFILVVNKCLN